MPAGSAPPPGYEEQVRAGNRAVHRAMLAAAAIFGRHARTRCRRADRAYAAAAAIATRRARGVELLPAMVGVARAVPRASVAVSEGDAERSAVSPTARPTRSRVELRHASRCRGPRLALAQATARARRRADASAFTVSASRRKTSRGGARVRRDRAPRRSASAAQSPPPRRCIQPVDDACDALDRAGSRTRSARQSCRPNGRSRAHAR